MLLIFGLVCRLKKKTHGNSEDDSEGDPVENIDEEWKGKYETKII